MMEEIDLGPSSLSNQDDGTKSYGLIRLGFGGLRPPLALNSRGDIVLLFRAYERERQNDVADAIRC